VAIAGIEAASLAFMKAPFATPKAVFAPTYSADHQKNRSLVSILAGLNRRMREARETGDEIRHDGKRRASDSLRDDRISAFVQPRSPTVQSHDLTKLRGTLM
jgi:hypothetical protein